MKSKFHRNYKQYSIVKQVPVYIRNTMARTLGEIFVKNVSLIFRKKADGTVTIYGGKTGRSCRFTVTSEAPLECPELAEELINQIIDWTIAESRSEYYRRASDKYKKQAKKLRDNYNIVKRKLTRNDN